MYVKRTWLLAFAALIAPANGQTRLDLATQSKTVDFSNASSTKPFKAGAALPAQCATGEAYLLLSGVPGRNLFICISTNTWSLQAGGLTVAPGTTGRVLTTTPDNNYEWREISGDLSGGVEAKVRGIQSRAVSEEEPEDGDALLWSSGSQSWTPGRTPAVVRVEIDGVEGGARATHNYITGDGLTSSATDTGTAVDIHQSINTAVVQTRANDQSGADKIITLTSSSASNFEGLMAPALAAYTSGMILPWTPNQTCSGAVTLDIDTLGARKVYEEDGLTGAACTSGRTYLIEYRSSLDSGNGGWRKVAGSGTGGTVQAGGVQSVNGETGAVTLTASSVGLGNVSNFYLATKEEAEAGTAANLYMTPLRTKEAIAYNAQPRVLGITIDGGGSTITSGVKGYVVVPFSCTIESWSMVADRAGSLAIDIWKHGSVPTIANSITGAAKPALVSAQLAAAQPVTGWTVGVAANDVLGFNVESASSVQRATLTIACRR